jgi:hypothetical protein
VAIQIDHLILLVLCLQPNNLKHTTMYLHLAVYTSVALIADIAWRRDDTADVSRRRDDTAGVRAVVTALAVSVFRLTTPVTLRRPCRPRGSLPLGAADRGGGLPHRHRRPRPEEISATM